MAKDDNDPLRAQLDEVKARLASAPTFGDDVRWLVESLEAALARAESAEDTLFEERFQAHVRGCDVPEWQLDVHRAVFRVGYALRTPRGK